MPVLDSETTSALPQGDVRLLDSEVAQNLLRSKELARVAYVAADGTPRVFPMLFHWTGAELVLPTFGNARKVPALRAKPDIAVTIDTTSAPPEVLLIRGRAEITEVDGVLDEYVDAQRRYYGEEQAALAEVGQPGVRMVRIAVRPSWVGVLDFRTRFPRPLTEQS